MGRQRIRIAAAVTACAAVTGLASACGEDMPPTVNYVVDADISSYNANSVDGNADGVLMATTRVLPGFSLLGNAGQVTPDRDIGTVTPEPGNRLTLRYEFTPQAAFSDGQPLDCDDLVLAWAAMSGRYPGFTPATTAGYRDIDDVACNPGDKAATVTFAAGRDYRDWLSLFGAGTLLPAHVVARTAGIGDVIAPIRSRNAPTVKKIAAAWNTGFDLKPGPIDTATFPASGPYRIDRYSISEGLVLVRNDAWWGDRAATDRVVVWGRGSDPARRLSEGGHDVVDVTAGMIPQDDDTDTGTAAVNASATGAPGDALGVEGLVLSGKGVFGDVRVRRAFASCVPRDALARQFGQGAQMWNLRTLAPADDLAGSLNGEFGRQYLRPDLERTRTLLADAAGTADDGTARPAARTVRIAYLAPTPRWQQMVTAIGESCKRAGITVTDVSSDTIAPGALGTAADALIVANGASFAAAGAADPIRDAYQLRGGDPLDLGSYRNADATRAIDELAVASLESERLGLVRTIERAAWDQVPSIPLFASPRVHRWNDRVGNVVAGLGRNGTGWNMDRWVLR
ncbi:ABC transporter substrate-binding protein [Gordonia sp. NB41Y]|uniref:ABC transporter substrate-binding protein n=1 Tax=Gordonia sp. NB41Y TaxID=875808 RepID=UPI0006B1839C|nr:ABC transporter substrate-binding protein [Gordonia sp. NB41Y]KOY49934.1 ABC transporter substrate-binding protein [Gordonia sp. NB41Y]WLP92945.1 ABC transporter substrate-binding protein [Gordonia sp. NB41Y]